MKICTKCKMEKEEAEFAWNNQATGSRMSQCKACRNNYHHAKNPPVIKEPTVDVDYFKNIDTCEKAYWLGFLYADGFMLFSDNKYKFCLQVAIQDDIIIDRLREAVKCKHIKQIDEFRNRALLKIGIQEFCLNLVDKGIIPRKTNIVKFPFEHLQNREDLTYSFILGYFDGDGSKSPTGAGSICSGNIEFLEEIKNYLQLENKILYSKNHWGSVYSLNIPKSRFFFMYKYYPYSLERKKIIIKEYVEEDGKVKRVSSKKSLLDINQIVTLFNNNVPVVDIAKKFNVVPMCIYRHLHKAGIRSK